MKKISCFISLGILLVFSCNLSKEIESQQTNDSPVQSNRSIIAVIPVYTCIGGDLCGGKIKYTAYSGYLPHLDYIDVYAHDNIGSRREACLECFVNGKDIGDEDVKRDGSVLRFSINASNVYTIQFRSKNCYDKSGGDETYIYTVILSNR